MRTTTRRLAGVLAMTTVVWSCVLPTALAEDDPPPLQWPQVDPPTTDTAGDPPVLQWPEPPKP